MSDLRENLKTELRESEYRYGYAESFLNTKLATQIKTLREQRDKTQAEAAALMGIKQPGYRRFEDINHSVWKTDTLWNVARAYGVRLDISFKTFGSLLDDKEDFNKERLKVPKFEDDPAFAEPAVEEPQPAEVFARAEQPREFKQGATTTGTGSVLRGLGLFEPIDPAVAEALNSRPQLFLGNSPQENRGLEGALAHLPGDSRNWTIQELAGKPSPTDQTLGGSVGIHLVVNNTARQRGTALNPQIDIPVGKAIGGR
jgi:transcriptional regulator with XRE-family HTH domain